MKRRTTKCSWQGKNYLLITLKKSASRHSLSLYGHFTVPPIWAANLNGFCFILEPDHLFLPLHFYPYSLHISRSFVPVGLVWLKIIQTICSPLLFVFFPNLCLAAKISRTCTKPGSPCPRWWYSHQSSQIFVVNRHKIVFFRRRKRQHPPLHEDDLCASSPGSQGSR